MNRYPPIALALALLLVCAAPLRAQTWTGAGDGTTWSDFGNWTPSTVPNSTADVAIFGTSGPTGVTVSNSIALDTLFFQPSAQSYNITIAEDGALNFWGAGITHGLNSLPQTIANNGAMVFHLSSDAGTVAITNTGTIAFNDSSTANSATITNGADGVIDVSANTGDVTIGGLSGPGAVITGSNTLIVAGAFSPGNGAGLLTVTGNLSLGAASSTTFGLGLGYYDAVNVTGTVTFGGAATVSLVNGFTPTAGNTFNLISGFTSQSGAFNSFAVGSTSLGTSASGFTGVVGGLQYDFTNATGTLAVSAVPEPSVYAAIMGVCTLGFAAYRRRRRCA